MDTSSASTGRYLRSFVELMEAKFPEQEDGGFVREGLVPGSWSTYKTDMGMPMNPAGQPPRGEYDQNEVLNKYEPRWTQMLNELGRWVAPSGVKIARISSSGFPYFTTSVAKKKDMFDIARSNPEHWSKALVQGRIGEVFEAGVSPLYTINYRKQADSWKGGVPKERSVTDFFGNQVIAQKTDLPGLAEGISASRTRLIYQASATFNLYWQMHVALKRKGLTKRYPHCFLHRGDSDLAAKLKDASWILSLDVKNYDQHQSRRLMALVYRSLGLSELGTLSWLALVQANVLQVQDYHGMRGHRFMHSMSDYEDASFKDSGIYRAFDDGYNPSGAAANDDQNKRIASLYTDEILNNSFSNWGWHDTVRTFDGIHRRVSVLNGGDNILFFGTNPTDRNAIETGISKSKLFEAEVELVTAFLGNGFIRKQRIQAINNPLTLPAPLRPERSAGSKARKFYRTGFHSRKELWMNNETSIRIYQEWDKFHQRFFGVNLDQHFGPAELPPVSGWANLQFLTDYSKIHYAIDEDEVDSQLLREYFTTISFSDLAPSHMHSPWWSAATKHAIAELTRGASLASL